MTQNNATKSISRFHTIEKEISDDEHSLKKIKQDLLEKRYLRMTLKRQFDFIKTQEQADELLGIANLYPEIIAGRQLQVMYYIFKFYTNKEIANACFIDEKTVKFHKTKIFNALDVLGEKGLLKMHQDRMLAAAK